MPAPIQRSLFVCLIALCPCLGSGCKAPTGASSTKDAPSAPPGGGTAPAEKEKTAPPPAVTHTPLNTRCEEMLVRLRDLDILIPVVFWQSKRSQERINEDTKEGIALARRFIAECPGTEPVCEVKSQLARFLFARGRRHRDEVERERHQKIKDSGITTPQMEAAWAEEKLRIDEEMKAYYKETAAMARQAADCKESSKGHQMGLFVLMKFAEQEFRYDEARSIGRAILEENPTFQFAPSVYRTVGSSYLVERRYKEAVAYMRDVIEKRESDLEYVFYNDMLFEALTGLGDLEGMEELVQRIRAEYPERMKTLDSEYYQSVYEQWYYNALFWVGYVRMALGDAEGAKAAFRESIAEVEALEAKLKAQEKVLNNVIKVFLDNRTRDLLYYLEELHGNPPALRNAKGAVVNDEKGVPRPLDFDLGAFWATEEKLTLKESRGKVVAAVFHTKGFHEDRSRPFLQAIDQLVKERAGDGLRGVWLSFLTGRGGLEEDMKAIESLREERKMLGVSLPAGYDPDRDEQRLFRSLSATVGSASFFVFDRKGRYAWYASDPLGRDVAIARRVIARILAEK